jgi:hypothetical protein
MSYKFRLIQIRSGHIRLGQDFSGEVKLVDVR